MLEGSGTQVTGFTSAEVAIMTQKLVEQLFYCAGSGIQFACFTSTNEKILTQKVVAQVFYGERLQDKFPRHRYSVYLLY
jgi:hypothetical protein